MKLQSSSHYWLCYTTAAILLLASTTIETRAREQPRHGIVRACGRALCDDGGPWPAVGASLFWGMWGYKFDRLRFEANLKFLADHGFDYIRVLGEVGGAPWKDRVVDPGWPEYDRAVGEFTDLAYQKYGLRVEWCLFGGTDFSTTPVLREARIDRFARAIVGHEQGVLLVEIANEGWKNGFPGPDGRKELTALAARLGAKLKEAGAKPLLRAITSPAATDVYGGVEVATVHTPRDRGDDGWRPIHSLSQYRDRVGMPPVITNDEPIGPGSSVNVENDPLKLVSQAIASYINGMAAYTYHTNAGIWGGGVSGQHRGPGDLWRLPQAREIAAGFKAMRGYVPADIGAWTVSHAKTRDHPFQGSATIVAAMNGPRFVALWYAVDGRSPLKATRAMTFSVIHPLTGATLRTVTLTAGQSVPVAAEPAAVFITGTFK